MYQLPETTRAAVIAALANGASLRATVRMTGASMGAVLRLLAEVGTFCETYHDYVVRQLATSRIEADEQWSFVGAKAKNAKQEGHGDLWTFCCLDADAKLVVSWVVGDRSTPNAIALMGDAADRIATDQVMISTDAFGGYIPAVREAFGWQRANYARVIKQYSTVVTEEGRRYSPATCISIKKEHVIGNPDMDLASTSYVENLNLSTRNHCKRFARLTIAHSKKAENHAFAVALNFFAHNFVRVHTTLSKKAGHPTTPAMAAGLSDHPMSWQEVVNLMNPKSVTIRQ